MSDIGKAYIQIVPSAKGLEGAISGQLDGEATKAGQSAGTSIVSTIKKAFIAAGIGKALLSTLQEGGKLQQSLGGIETLFKDNAEKVKGYAKEAYRTTGLSANSYMENVTGFSASLLQSLGGDTAKAAEIANMAMVDMADNSNKMGTSMESIQYAYQGFAKQNYTMLDNLKLGYGGTKSEMERLLKDAQKITGVKYDINNLNDVYSAIHVIQGELDITGTTAKEASTTLTGSFNAMKASFTDVLGALATGNGLNDAIKGLATSASTFLFDNLVPMLGNIITALPGALATFISSAAEGIASKFGIVNTKISSKFKEIGTNLQPVIDSITKAFSKLPELFETIVNSLSPIIETIVNGFAKMDFSGISNLIDAIIPALQSAFTTFISIVSPAIDKIVNSFVGFWNAIQPVYSLIAEALQPVLNILASFLGGVFAGILEGVSGLFDILKGVIQFLTPVFEFLVGVLKGVAPVLQVIAEWVGKVIGWFTGLGGAGSKLSEIMKSAWEGIKNAISIAKDGISIAISAIKTVFSALKTAGDTLKSGLTFVWNGIKSAITIAKDVISGAINGIQTFFANLKSAGEALKTGISNAWNAMKDVISTVSNTIKGIIDKVKSWFTSLGNINLFGAGKAILDGFLGGLKSAYGRVKDFVGGIAGWIRRNKGPISYDKRLLIPAGRAIMQGLNNGIVQNFKDVKSNVSQIASNIAGEFGNTNITPELMSDKNFNRQIENNLRASFDDNTDFSNKTPIELILHLGNNVFKTFVEDITNLQDEKLELELAY